MSTRFGSNTDSPLVQADFDNVASAAIDAGKSLPQMLIDVSKRFGSRPAFSNMGKTLSHADLDRLSAQLAGYLRGELKLEAGERVAVMMPNLLQFPVAVLGILRADFHVIRKWDLLAEARVLHLAESRTTKYGFLAAAYRHFGDNMKIGVGYNFGHFSDDLRDLTYDDQGIFLNAIGKF